MHDWKSMLKADATHWLLEEEHPSVRYCTLKDILDKPEHDLEVQEARDAIMHHGIVPDILQAQQKPAYRATYPKFYTDKYKGLVWQMIVLAEMGAEADRKSVG